MTERTPRGCVLCEGRASAIPRASGWNPGAGMSPTAGAGAGQEALLVVPSLNLVVARYGQYLSPAGAKRFWIDLADYLFQPIVEAISQRGSR